MDDVGVGHGHDPRGEVDVFPAQLARVALAVPALVVLQRDDPDLLGVLQVLGDDAVGMDGMRADLVHLLRGELLLLLQDGLREP